MAKLVSRARQAFLILAGGAAVGLALAAATNPRDLLLYNHSPSVPPGLYVRIAKQVDPGIFVTVRARDVDPEEAHRRGFEDASNRFIKRVAAVGGAHVCGDGRRLSVNGVDVAVISGDRRQHAAAGVNEDHFGGGADDRHPAAAHDRRHDLIGWRGCRVLAADEVLLLGETTDSFDGRYWGPINASLIEGVWRKL